MLRKDEAELAEVIGFQKRELGNYFSQQVKGIFRYAFSWLSFSKGSAASDRFGSREAGITD